MSDEEFIEAAAKAMQSSSAWPAVFTAGSAEELARAVLPIAREMAEAESSGELAWLMG